LLPVFALLHYNFDLIFLKQIFLQKKKKNKEPKQLEKAIYILSACHIVRKGLLVMVKLILLQIATTDCCTFLVMHLLAVLPTLAKNG